MNNHETGTDPQQAELTDDELTRAEQVVELGAMAIVRAMKSIAPNPTEHEKLVRIVADELKEADLVVTDSLEPEQRRGAVTGRTRDEVIHGLQLRKLLKKVGRRTSLPPSSSKDNPEHKY